MTTLALAKHLDYTAFQVEIEDAPGIQIPVVEAVAECCEMCDPGDWENPKNQAADYVLDAVSVLGQAGYNVAYCERHLYAAIFVYSEDTNDVWTVKA